MQMPLPGGSSPHARGLRTFAYSQGYGRRIIPARAGFTRYDYSCHDYAGDHPRTRGVYPKMKFLSNATYGIIPARAGFTVSRPRILTIFRDHPRTRGVYAATDTSVVLSVGSSPHARGLRVISPLGPGTVGSSPHARGLHTMISFCMRTRRIIPARAGFTLNRTRPPGRRQDHPRTRGVYLSRPRLNSARGGSSPHARGLRVDKRPNCLHSRIIPARAGFT